MTAVSATLTLSSEDFSQESVHNIEVTSELGTIESTNAEFQECGFTNIIDITIRMYSCSSNEDAIISSFQVNIDDYDIEPDSVSVEYIS